MESQKIQSGAMDLEHSLLFALKGHDKRAHFETGFQRRPVVLEASFCLVCQECASCPFLLSLRK